MIHLTTKPPKPKHPSGYTKTPNEMTTLFPSVPLGPALSNPAPAKKPQREVTLIGKHVTLEPLSPFTHTASLYKHMCCCPLPPDIKVWPGWAYLPVGPFASEQDFNAQVTAYSESTDPFFYAVVAKQDFQSPISDETVPAGSALGWLSLLNIETAHQSVEIGHVGFSSYLQRTVLSTEAFYLVMRYAFGALGNRRVEWKCDSLNEPSRRAAERIGFVYEGLFRKHRIVRGRNRDTAWFSIVDEEWEGEGGVKAGFQGWLSGDNFDGEGRQKRKLEEFRRTGE